MCRMCVHWMRLSKPKRRGQRQGQYHFKVQFKCMYFNILLWFLMLPGCEAHTYWAMRRKKSKQKVKWFFFEEQPAAEPVNRRPYKWFVYLNWAWITIYNIFYLYPLFVRKIQAHTHTHTQKNNIKHAVQHLCILYSWEDIVTFIGMSDAINDMFHLLLEKYTTIYRTNNEQISRRFGFLLAIKCMLYTLNNRLSKGKRTTTTRISTEISVDIASITISELLFASR